MEIDRADAMNVPGYVGHIGTIRDVLAFLDAADETTELPDFLSFSEASDKIFGDDWREASPELALYIDAYMAQRKHGLSGLLQRFYQPTA
jgi:hypothetical protein